MQDPYQRWDLLTRVFQLKLQSLLHEDIVTNGLFGRCVAWNYSIEFQKRGLVHCHMLIYLCEEDKIRKPENVDQFTSAELPDKKKDKELFDIILRNNIHGLCGDDNPSAACMQENGSA